MPKSTRVCRYANCQHPTTEIDIVLEDYRIDGKKYYHPDCYEKRVVVGCKTDKEKADLQYIKTQWLLHISKTVVYSQLMTCLNELLERGISSEYLVFVMDYVVSHKMQLRYPGGFKFFVDRKEIQDAYKKKKAAEAFKDFEEFQKDRIATNQTNSPSFKIQQRKTGFGGILGGGK